ncbi:MAG: hypothetical protein ACI8W8_003592 [Rhodothermales bacterium]|jgi:hypothetical protein
MYKDEVDFSVLVDIISNVAGMMIMMACFAMLIREEEVLDNEEVRAKPIAFPLAYIPNKQSVTMAVKNGQFYVMPQEQLLRAVVEKTEGGGTVETLELNHDGVQATLGVTPTLTGFRFQYKLLPEGGVPVTDTLALTRKLRELVKRFPGERFFYTIHAWPEDFAALRDVREFFLEQQVEVGWSPEEHREAQYDMVFAIGEYSERMSSIKAQ